MDMPGPPEWDTLFIAALQSVLQIVVAKFGTPAINSELYKRVFKTGFLNQTPFNIKIFRCKVDIIMTLTKHKTKDQLNICSNIWHMTLISSITTVVNGLRRGGGL